MQSRVFADTRSDKPTPHSMRTRPSSRLLVLNPDGDVLLFRFTHQSGPLAGQDFWATPGGGVEPGESYEDAAVRELLEETGIKVADPGRPVARREVVLQLPEGEYVRADERYFVVQVNVQTIQREGWTRHELEVMADYRWWSIPDLDATGDTVWPENLTALLRSIVSIGREAA